MTKLFFISIVLTSFLSSCNNKRNTNSIETSSLDNQQKNMDLDMDFLDAYKLKIGNIHLYGKYEDFIGEFGLPNKLTIIKKDFTINTKLQLDTLVKSADDISGVTLHYPGLDMSYADDYGLIPFHVDFRKFTKSITYGQIIFDTTYTLEQFRKTFPISSNPEFSLPQSLFEITTKEQGDKFKHFMLYRKSKDDSSATPMIEFTFRNKQLIYILFANF